MSRRWTREGPSHMRCAPWTICSVVVAGGELFVLSRDGEERATARDKDLKALQQMAKDIETKEAA